MLQRVQQAGIGCPEPIAVGEDDKGQAFLLLRALDDATELRRLLATLQSADRRQLARQLSEMLARIHAAGIDHPDLYSKHVLVRSGPSTGRFTFHFLDWQRSRQRRALPWRRRFRDLAALDATLAPNLATPRERLLCLYAYLRRAGGIRRAARAITRLSRRLQQRRRIREMHRLPLAPGTQNLIWLDGETLCVTREFYNRLGGTTPRWLAVPGGPSGLQCETVVLPDGRQAQLTRRWSSRPLAWLWSCLRGRRLTSPELRAAGTIFRMQRLGVQMPNLLAVGQKTIRPWQVASFLLVEPVPGAVDPLAVEGRA
jgi:tRNA A-37 threonylcarbamoyl transferase component Bud32